MDPEFQSYIDNVLKQIRWKKAHENVGFDLAGVLQELYKWNRSRGMDHREAIYTALETSGPPEMVGRQMDDVFRPQHSWDLFLVLAIFGACSILVADHILNFSIQPVLPAWLKVVGYTLAFCLGYCMDARVITKNSSLIYMAYLLVLGTAVVVDRMLLQFSISSYVVALYPILFTGIAREVIDGNTLSVVKSLLSLLPPAMLYITGRDVSQLVPMMILCTAVLSYAVSVNASSRVNRCVAVTGVSVGTGSLLALMLVIAARLKGVTVSGLVDPVGYWSRRDDLRMAVSQLQITGTGLQKTVGEYLAAGEQMLLLGHMLGILGLATVLLCYGIFFYYSIDRAVLIHNHLGKLLSISILGYFQLVLATQILGTIGLGVISISQPVSLLTPGIPAVLSFLLAGLLLGTIRDGEVIYDWPDPDDNCQ